VTPAAAERSVERLAAFSLASAEPAALAVFYQRAFGCRIEALLAPGGDAPHGIALTLGAQRLELLEFDPPGEPYPRASSACDLNFQHCAIVVRDMATAFERLCGTSGWSAISSHGPQRLPASSGGVTAFKFRDPEGHPLELLAFPRACEPEYWRAPDGELCLGIDHSAISVADSARSIAFYRSLGFEVASESLNHGPEQARLDGLVDPRVEVTALAPLQATPHLELLCYRQPEPAAHELHPHDIAATRLVLQTRECRARPELRRDPDGHYLLLTGV
jgi:catechol 2,3-dioxygenase-like lactoylglutathione lyase family enzyme